MAFFDLSAENMMHVVKSDKLDIDEVDLIKAVVKWAEKHSKKVKKTVKEVLAPLSPHLRYPLLAIQDIATIVTPLNILQPGELLGLYTYLGTKSVKQSSKPPSSSSSSDPFSSLTDSKKKDEKEEDPVPILPDNIKHFSGKERNPREGRKALQKYELSYSAVYTVGTSFVSINTIQSLHDGDYTTGVAIATASPAWIQAKFKKNTNITSVTIAPLHQNPTHWGPTNGNGGQIQYALAESPSNWVNVGTIAYTDHRPQVVVIGNGKGIKAQYWRLSYTGYLGTSSFVFSNKKT